MYPKTKDLIPGLDQAKYVQRKIRETGIFDVQLFWDPPKQRWVVCQVQKSAGIIMPNNYFENGVKPMIMWYCQDEGGNFRAPNENDIIDTIITVQKAQRTFDKGADWLEKKLEEKDEVKKKAAEKGLQDRIKSISKPMKKAIREELL